MKQFAYTSPLSSPGTGEWQKWKAWDLCMVEASTRFQVIVATGKQQPGVARSSSFQEKSEIQILCEICLIIKCHPRF